MKDLGVRRFAYAFRLTLWGLSALGLAGAAVFLLILHSPVPGLRALIVSSVCAAMALFEKWTGRLALVGHTLIVTLLGIAVLSASSLGLRSTLLTTLVLLSPIATFTGGRRSGLLWLVVSFGVLGFAVARTPSEDLAYEMSVLLCTGVSMLMTAWVTLAFFEVTRQQAAHLVAQNKALQQKELASQAASQAKGVFLATMSHEIRTPLNAVIGMATLLADRALPEGEREMVQQIQRSGDLLLGLVNDILDMSRIESGELRILTAPFELLTACRDVVGTFQGTARERGLSLRLEIQGEASHPVVGDAGRLRQVLLNLVSNALKFTRSGGVTLRVILQPPAAGQQDICIEVEDSGVGIALEAQARIFEAFVQADQRMSRAYEGSGLGLSISSRLMAMMGGTLALAWSHPGQGSCFQVRLTLPISSLEVAPDGLAEVLPALDGVRVLVVEDNRINQRVVCAMLSAAGCSCVLAENGAEALEAGLVDVILMDQQMPVMDGLSATRALRARGDQTPIIALTANAFDEDRVACLEAGMDDFLTKPIQRELLLKTIARLAAAGQTQATAPAS